MVKCWRYEAGSEPRVVIEYEDGRKRVLDAGSKARNSIEKKVVRALKDYMDERIHYGPGRGFSWVRLNLFFRLCEILGSEKALD